MPSKADPARALADILENIGRIEAYVAGLDQEIFESMNRATPLGRAAEPEEIAGTVVFLASTHAAFITGATINITGGFLMY